MFRLRSAVVLALLSLVGSLAGGAPAGVSKVGFSPPVYIDQHLAGGEPLVLADPAHGTLIYTSHEGTTHLFRQGFLSVWSDADFTSNYCNQVNVWTSRDGGTNWFRTRFLGTQCPTDPTKNTGFSDPDLTLDAGGRIYNTGIDLANDALFSSADRAKQRLAEPTVYANSSGRVVGLGVSTWRRGDSAFTPHFVAPLANGVWASSR